MRTFASFDEAAQAFDAYARIEPRLVPLWDLCRNAQPEGPEDADLDSIDDAYDSDPFELDEMATVEADE